MEAGAMSIASIQATLEAHAEIARRLNRQYELTSPAPVGVTADGSVDVDDLRRLLFLADERLLRNLLGRLTSAEIRELQSTLDDVQADQFNGGAALASQNFLLERFQEAEARAPPPVLMPPVVVMQYASDSFQATPEILERQRTIYQNTARLRSIEIPEGLPPPPPTPPPTSGVDLDFGFSFADLGYRMCVLDRAIELRIDGERPRVSDFLLAGDLFHVQDRIHHFFRDVYLVQDAAGQEALRHQARIAEPLRAYDDLSGGDQLRYYYDYEWPLRSRYYQYLSELMQLHHNNPEGQQRAAYARYKQRQEARAAALLNTDVDVGSSLGRLLVLQATTLMGGFFGDITD